MLHDSWKYLLTIRPPQCRILDSVDLVNHNLAPLQRLKEADIYILVLAFCRIKVNQLKVVNVIPWCPARGDINKLWGL